MVIDNSALIFILNIIELMLVNCCVTVDQYIFFAKFDALRCMPKTELYLEGNILEIK